MVVSCKARCPFVAFKLPVFRHILLEVLSRLRALACRRKLEFSLFKSFCWTSHGFSTLGSGRKKNPQIGFVFLGHRLARLPFYKIIWFCPCLWRAGFQLTHFHKFMLLQIKAVTFFLAFPLVLYFFPCLCETSSVYGVGKEASVVFWGLCGTGNVNRPHLLAISAVNHQLVAGETRRATSRGWRCWHSWKENESRAAGEADPPFFLGRKTVIQTPLLFCLRFFSIWQSVLRVIYKYQHAVEPGHHDSRNISFVYLHLFKHVQKFGPLK